MKATGNKSSKSSIKFFASAWIVAVLAFSSGLPIALAGESAPDSYSSISVDESEVEPSGETAQSESEPEELEPQENSIKAQDPAPLPEVSSQQIEPAAEPANEDSAWEDFPAPENQSSTPAPASREKLVLENVHTDAVSAYLDSGTLVLESKADVDVNGDEISELGVRFNPKELLFHLSNAGKTKVREGSIWESIGSPGTEFWLAPQVQNYDVIWPGFSTEDPNLRGKAKQLNVRLVSVTGPGKVRVVLGEDIVFSSEEGPNSWIIRIPQHAHMGWGFSEPGTYEFLSKPVAKLMADHKAHKIPTPSWWETLRRTHSQPPSTYVPAKLSLKWASPFS